MSVTLTAGAVALADCRSRLAWTQERAADFLEVGYSLFCKLERGVRTPSLKLAARIEERTHGAVRAVEWTKAAPPGAAAAAGGT